MEESRPDNGRRFRRAAANSPARLACGIGLALLVALPVTAQGPARPINQFGHESWQVRDGLPQSSVHTIVQTRDGYLWMGTQQGLVRFDGVRFTLFRGTNTPQMRADHVSALHETKDGTLWVGTYGGGLLSLKAGRFHAYTTADGLSGDTVVALAEDADRALWVATHTEGISRLTASGFATYSAADGLGSAVVTSVIVDATGAVWAGTSSGLSRFDNGKFVNYTVRDGLAGDYVTALAADPGGGVWVGAQEGLTLWRDGRAATDAVPHGLPHAAVQTLHVDAAGGLWVGTKGGVGRLVDGTFSTLTTRDGLASANVVAICQDREGSIWIGMDGGGLSRWHDSTFYNLGESHGLGDEVAYSIAGSRRGGFWVGTEGGGVFRFKDGRFNRTVFSGPMPATTVRALLEDSQERLWIGSERRLYRCKGARCDTYDSSAGLPEFAVRVVFEDRDGRIWVGTDGGGLSRIDDRGIVTYTERDGLAENRIRTVVPAGDGGIWIGTYGGLSHYKDGVFRSYTRAQGLPHTFVRSLYEDTDGTLWIATYGGGLIRFNGAHFAAGTTANGLLSDAIFQILDDGLGNLWLSSNAGVFRVNKQQFKAFADGSAPAVASTAYGESDGMKSRECNGGNPGGWKSDDGQLMFATTEGVAVVDPGRLRKNLLPPPVMVEEVLVDGRPIAPGDSLPAGSKRFEIGYTGLSFVAHTRMRFAYRLEGFDEEWADAGTQRSAVYTNLPPGTYRFVVRAISGDGVPSAADASFGFVLRPFFYQTWLFYGVCAFLLAGAFGGFYHWRTRQLRVRERQLQAKVADAVAHIRTLRGMLPICASCKRVRDDSGYWNQIEVYVREHSEAVFSHGICPDCMHRLYPEDAAAIAGPPVPADPPGGERPDPA